LLNGNLNLDTYPDQKKIQHHALATLYYSATGVTWDHSGKEPWRRLFEEIGFSENHIIAVFHEYS
jgi:hypothetical protein